MSISDSKTVQECREEGCTEDPDRYGWCEEHNTLTAKQRVFVDEYVSCLNGAEAARRAQYSPNNDNPRTVAYKLRQRPYIKKAIDHLMEDRIMDANEAMTRMSLLAQGEKGHMPDVDDLDARDVREALRDILKLHDAYDETINVDMNDAVEDFAAIFGIDLGDEDDA